MPVRMWRDGAVTIVLLAGGKHGTDLLDLAREWTQRELLVPAIWVRLERVTRPVAGPPTVLSTIIAPDLAGGIIEQDVDLFEALAQESLSQVRIVKVRSALPDAVIDSAQDEIADMVSKYVGHAMPQASVANSDTDSTQLQRFSLICAPTQQQLEERITWAANDMSTLVVGSPEDRATPTAGDAFVRDNERFTGFVLMHLATVGGMWQGVPIGSLELFEREGSASRSVWVQRVFVSGVLTGGLARRTAAEVLEGVVGGRGSVAATGVQVTPDGTAVIPVGRVSSYVDRMVHTAMNLDDAALSFRSPEALGLHAPRNVSIREQVGLFWHFSVGKVARIPHWIGLWFHDLFARKLGNQLQGKDGYRAIEMLLDQRPDSHDQSLLLTVQRIHQADEESRASLSAAPRSSGRRVTPRLWAGLRQLVFSSVDGSAGPKGGSFDPIEDRVPVFAALSEVAPDPLDAWVYSGSKRPRGIPERLTWAEYRQRPELAELVARVKSKADRAFSAQTLKHDELAAKFASLVAEFEELRDALIDAGLLRLRADGRATPVKQGSKKVPVDEGDTASEQGLKPSDVARWQSLDNKQAAIEESLAVVAAHRDSLRVAATEASDVHDQFLAWVDRCQRTFVGRLSDEMATNLGGAKGELTQAESRSASLPEAGELIRLRKRFHRGLLIWFAVIALIAAAIILVPIILRDWIAQGSEPVARAIAEALREGRYPEWWVVILVAVGVLLIIGVVLVARYYRGWSGFERRVERAQFEVETRFERVRILRGEVQRLESLHDQTQSWLATLSGALYQPWAVRPEWRTAGLVGLNPVHLPFAMHIGQSVQGSGTGTDRLKREAAKKLLKQGWRADAFHDLVNEVGDRLGFDHDRFGIDTLENDLPDAPNNTRTMLSQNLGNQDVLEAIALRRLRVLAEELQDESLYGEGTLVESMEHDPLAAFRVGGSTVSWREFLSQTIIGTLAPTPLSALGIAPHLVQKGHHEGVRSYVLAPESVTKTLSPEQRQVLDVRELLEESDHSLDIVVRVDIAGPVPVDALAILSGGVDESSPAVSVPASAEQSGI